MKINSGIWSLNLEATLASFIGLAVLYLATGAWSWYYLVVPATSSIIIFIANRINPPAFELPSAGTLRIGLNGEKIAMTYELTCPLDKLVESSIVLMKVDSAIKKEDLYV